MTSVETLVAVMLVFFLAGTVKGVVGFGLPLVSISLLTPLYGLVDAVGQFINEFKDGAYLINTGRGKTIIERDVVEALKSGKLAGFGNDVWYSDPPENTPLIDAPNVIALPHLGASTKESLSRIGDIIESIIHDFITIK